MNPRRLLAYLPAALLGVGFALTALVASIAWNSARERHETAFADIAGNVRDDVSGRVNGADEVITGLANLVNSSMHVDADQFRVFSEDVLRRHRFIVSSAYLPLVIGAERAEFEQAQRETGFPTFSITKRTRGRYTPASTHDRYFPLLFQEPFEPSTAVMIGFDVGSDPDLAGAAQLAIDSGEATPAAPRILYTGRRGYWLFKAIYAGKTIPEHVDDRRRSVNGLIALRLDGARLLPDTIRHDAPGLRLGMSGPFAAESLELTRAGRWNDVPSTGIMARSFVVGAGGHRLTLDIQRSVDWYDIDYRLVIATCVIGALMTALLVVSVEYAMRRQRELAQRNLEIERQVAQKTAELAHEKERAEVTLASIGDAVITTDAESRIEYLNPVAEKLTGWTNAEARGHPLSEVFHVVNEQSGAAVDLSATQGDARWRGYVRGDVLLDRLNRLLDIDHSAAPILTRTGAMSGIVVVFHDVSQQRRMAEEMSYRATHDALTGLVNRAAFEDRLESLVTSAHAHGYAHAMLYLDLDQFKIVNDTAGHAAGDELLRQLVALLRRHVRGSDTVARLGGDEFGVLLTQCSVDDAVVIANKIRSAVHDYRFVWKDRTFIVGVSIGLVPITCETGGASAIQTAADAACYAAKEKGRNRVQVFESDSSELAVRRTQMQWAARLRQAVEQDRLVLYAQPIIDVVSGAVVQREVLVRLLDVDGKLVPPDAFIPAAERFDLMPTIDRWVVRNTLQWLACHAELIEPGTQYNINLSGQSLSDDTFLPFLLEQFDASGVRADRVGFEVTETAAVATLDSATRFVRALRRRGCHFLLDDFGSGWSSFAYLKSLPVDSLKIDGSFVADMAHDPLDRAMVSSINEIGHTMGMRTVAEFVENAETLDMLRDLGVDFAQGYAIGRPQPIGEHLKTREPSPSAYEAA